MWNPSANPETPHRPLTSGCVQIVILNYRRFSKQELIEEIFRPSLQNPEKKPKTFQIIDLQTWRKKTGRSLCIVCNDCSYCINNFALKLMTFSTCTPFSKFSFHFDVTFNPSFPCRWASWVVSLTCWASCMGQIWPLVRTTGWAPASRTFPPCRQTWSTSRREHSR